MRMSQGLQPKLFNQSCGCHIGTTPNVYDQGTNLALYGAPTVKNPPSLVIIRVVLAI